MPIGKGWIYRLLFVCNFVRLPVSPARIKLAASNFAQWFIGVVGRESPILGGNFAPQKPKIADVKFTLEMRRSWNIAHSRGMWT